LKIKIILEKCIFDTIGGESYVGEWASRGTNLTPYMAAI
jgi:hypothetical protein